MKCLAIALFFISLTFVQCSEHLETVKNAYKNVHHQRKAILHSQNHLFIENCPTIREQINEAQVYFDECSGRIDDSLTMCERAKPFLLNCTSQFVKVIDNCTSEKSKGLSLLASQSLYSAVNYFCHKTGEELLELANSCIWNDLEEKTPDLIKCENKLMRIARKYKVEEPTTRTYCDDLHQFKNCIEIRINHTCKNPVTKKSFIGLYDALLKPCHESDT